MRRTPRLAPVLVDEGVAQNGEQPRLYVSAFFELIMEAQRLHQGVLGEVLGIGGVAGQTQCHRMHHVQVFEHQFLELP